MRLLVTGTAGFIGFHLARRLLDDGHEVLGFDGLTDYYDVSLKQARHAVLERHNGFHPIIGMLEDLPLLQKSVADFAPERVFHLAAQAGVRYSIEHPETYISSNIVGTFHLLEALRAHPPKHLLFASTSSIYGANPDKPFSETARTDFPLSVYAATKRGAEALTHSYAHLFGTPTTCFRFFTVYGSWGRPDMALYKFARAIEMGEPIDIYAEGRQTRDFTHVSDLIEGVVRLAEAPPVAGMPIGPIDSLSPVAPWRTVNIGGGAPTRLPDFIAELERALGKRAIQRMVPAQPGDVTDTDADPALLEALTGYRPRKSLAAGIAEFVAWYRSHTAP